MFRFGAFVICTIFAVSGQVGDAAMSSSAVSVATKPDSTIAKAAQSVTPQQPVSLVMPSLSESPPEAPQTKPQVDTLHPVDRLPIGDSLRIPVLDLDNADIRDILRGMGMQYGVNIYIEPGVTGAVSLYLSDVSVKNAVDFIVRRSGCAYTVENGIIKVYKPVETPPLPPEPRAVFKFKNGLVDIDFRDLPVADVARLFSDSAGMNVIVENGVEGKISGRLVSMKPEKALRVIVESNKMSLTNNDGIYYIGNSAWGNDDASGKPGTDNQLKRLSLTVKNGYVTIEINNASLDQVVRSIALQSGIDIVIYDHLSGEVSAKIDSIPIDDALRFMLQNTKFTFWKERGIYFVGSREMNQQKTTVIIPLRHIMAEETGIGRMLPPTISTNAVIKYNSEHNAIIVIGSFEVVAQAQEFIETIDKPIPQVLIEALVVDFNVNKIHEYGMSLFTGSSDSSVDWLSEKFLPTLDLKPGRKKTERVLEAVLKSFGVDRIVELPSNFRAAIQALESADIVRVHSTPQIATINGNAASIIIGETRYYKLQKETSAAVQSSSTVIGTDERFEVIKFNTQLEVTPWVMDKGYVMVKIRPEFNIPRTGGDASTPPNVDTRVIESMVRLRNGQTIVLGGQRQTENVVSRKGIPLLSSIPVLGWLFSSRTVSKNETQMMIFLTPHVYYGDDNAVSPDAYFGKEVNKILDKYDIDKKEKRRERTSGRRPKLRLFRRRSTQARDSQNSVPANGSSSDSTVSVSAGDSVVTATELHLKAKNDSTKISFPVPDAPGTDTTAVPGKSPVRKGKK